MNTKFMDNNPIQRGLEAAIQFEKRQTAQAKVQSARHMRDYASAMLDAVMATERYYECCSVASEFIAKGELKKRFDNISDREREIGTAFARYILFGRAD